MDREVKAAGGDPTIWGRRTLMAVLKSPNEFQDALGPRFPAFVKSFRALLDQRAGQVFDPAAAATALRGIVQEFDLHAWLAANARPAGPRTRSGAVRTRGAAQRAAVARPATFEGLLEEVRQVLARAETPS